MHSVPDSAHRSVICYKEDEQGDGEDEHPARPETVRQPAAHGDEHGDGERVAHYGKLHRQRRTVEAVGHGGEGGVEDGGVQRLHEEGRRRDGGQSGQFFDGKRHTIHRLVCLGVMDAGLAGGCLSGYSVDIPIRCPLFKLSRLPESVGGFSHGPAPYGNTPVQPPFGANTRNGSLLRGTLRPRVLCDKED